MGFKISHDDATGRGSIELLWLQNCPDSNARASAGDVIYGTFSTGSYNKTMAKYFDAGNKKPSSIELWSVSTEKGTPPAQYNAQVNNARLK